MRVVSVDGQVVPQLEGLYSPAAPVAEAELLTTAGQPLLVELVQEAVTEAPIKFPLWFLGRVFALLGAAVLLRRPDLDSSRWFAAFAGSAAVALAVGPAAGGPHPHWSLVIQVLALISVGVTCAPSAAALAADGSGSRRRLLTIAFAAIGAAITVAYFISVLAIPNLYEAAASGHPG
jgi:drug/metabolite transporter (DMT)-like permease